MTSSLFQEALADAKQLREVAEQNAKNAIIESVTPKIRKFIEDQLLEGAKRQAGVDQIDEEEQLDIATDGDESIDAAASPEGLAERVSLLRTMNNLVESLTPEESASLIPVVEKMRDAVLNKPGAARISRAVPSDVRSTHIVKENAAMQGKNKMYEVDLDELMSDEISAEDEGMHMGHAEDEGMDLEYEGMGHGHMEDEAAEDEGMEDEMADLYESLSSLLEAEEEGDDEPIEPTGEDEESEDEESEDAGGMPDAGGEMEGLKPEIEDIKSELDQIKEMLQQLMAAQGGEAAPPAGAEMPPEEEMAPPPGAEAMPPGAAPGPSERVYRVDESALLRELRALREGFSEKAKKPKLAGKPLPEAYAEDEAAEDEDMGLDEMMDEPKGKSAHEGKSGAMPTHTKGHGAGKAAPFTEKGKVMKENRDLKVSLAKHAEAIESLRGQLTEMNLFNAKLLYVNRLLQDRDLSDGQRRNIIESLDRARSLREVKLLYKGLSESIGRKPAARKPELVSESVGSRAVSPTSRPLSTSGVRLNEAVEVHRWAVLAGIGSKS
jgi:hypothetical protein